MNLYSVLVLNAEEAVNSDIMKKLEWEAMRIRIT